MFIDQPLPHIARIHPEPKVFGDLRALEMALTEYASADVPIHP